MTPLQQYQTQFAAALLDGERPPPDQIAAARFAIHRNNVHASLVATVQARYPVIARLVGEEFFRALALAFLQRHPPRSPVLARYGEGFANFLRGFAPVRELPYLPDMASLEWARHAAYHAADAETAAIADLAALPEAVLESARLVLHPAAAVVISDYPIVPLWQTNAQDEEVKPIGPDHGGESALVTRPHLEVLVRILPSAGAAFFDALRQGQTLGAAVEKIDRPDEVPRLLATLFDAGAIARIVVERS